MTENIFTSLRLQNFRSYSDYAIELSPNVNIVVGPNASGKTNLLESILLLSGSSSYRANYGDIINFNCDWARVDGNLTDSDRSIKIQNINENIEKSYVINDKTKKRLTFDDIMPTILFEPNDMLLLTGSPEARREYIDNILTKTIAQYGVAKNSYKRVLAQRNKLLKMPSGVVEQQLFAWNIRLCELAGYLVKNRIIIIDKLNEHISQIYSEIATKNNTVRVEYISNISLKNYESDLLKTLENNLQKDLQRGFTGYGPHRDDFVIYLDNQKADISASRGETRTLVLSLKLLEINITQEARGGKPLILLDDVFSELDGSRRKALTSYLNGYQTIITTTDADVIAKNFAQASNLISL